MYPYQCPYPLYPLPYVLVPVIPIHLSHQNEPRNYPEVDTTKFEQSSKVYQSLIEDSQILSKQFTESNQLRIQVMQEAQKANHETVVNLIRDTGISHPFEVSYDPDSIKVTFLDVEERPTSKLIMALRW